MKKLMFFATLIVASAMLASCDKEEVITEPQLSSSSKVPSDSLAQNPDISTRYSNEEIIQMIDNYRTAHSRDVMPPANLQQKFQADFPNAYDVEWEMANDIYEVEFEISRRDFNVLYDAEGNLLLVVEEIHSSQLPAAVKTTAEAKYPEYNFEDIKKIRRGTETLYKVEMERSFSDTEVKLLINADGTLLEERFDY